MGVWHRISAEFDDPNLLGVAGLVPVVARAGLHLICPAFLGQRLLCFQAAFW